MSIYPTSNNNPSKSKVNHQNDKQNGITFCVLRIWLQGYFYRNKNINSLKRTLICYFYSDNISCNIPRGKFDLVSKWQDNESAEILLI